MSSLITDLRETTAARWRHGLIRETRERPHWSTKEAYYRAVIACLEDGAQISWESIIERVRPRGAPSTYYTVTGGRATHALIRAYTDDALTDIASAYRRTHSHDQLVDETKVWSYWPSREGWLTQLAETTNSSRPIAVECLVRVLADWAVNNQVLAAALDGTPPMCAVEDLRVIQGARGTTLDAARLLESVVKLALSPLGGISDGVLNAVREDLGGEISSIAADPETLLAQLAETISALVEAPSLPKDVRSDAAALLEDGLIQITEEPDA